jgi:Matrixin
MKARLLSALCGAATLALSSHSFAFCRATTCDPSKDACERDSGACLTTGTPLFWASSCFQVYVQADGAPKQGISFATAKESVSRAFTTWLSADCGGAAPLIDVQVLGPITCATAEYNSTQKNANIVLFREDEWPYIGAEDALGFTHLHFDANTGELWDADLEINAVAYRFSVGDPVTDNDLDSMLTHEAGHMLGLAHTLVTSATMFANYTPGTDTQRTLDDDDIQGVCAAYPAGRMPSRTSCSPRHGFSDLCSAEQPANSATDEGTDQATASSTSSATAKGCSFSKRAANPGLFWPALVLGGAVGLRLRRRKSRHHFVSCPRPARQR